MQADHRTIETYIEHALPIGRARFEEQLVVQYRCTAHENVDRSESLCRSPGHRIDCGFGRHVGSYSDRLRTRLARECRDGFLRCLAFDVYQRDLRSAESEQLRCRITDPT